MLNWWPPLIPVVADQTVPEADLGQSFWQRAAELGAPGLIAEMDPMAALLEGWIDMLYRQASAAFGGDWLRSGQPLGLLLP